MVFDGIRKKVHSDDESECSADYTQWRKFLAWVGIVALGLIIIGLAVALVWANAYINANLGYAS